MARRWESHPWAPPGAQPISKAWSKYVPDEEMDAWMRSALHYAGLAVVVEGPHALCGTCGGPVEAEAPGLFRCMDEECGTPYVIDVQRPTALVVGNPNSIESHRSDLVQEAWEMLLDTPADELPPSPPEEWVPDWVISNIEEDRATRAARLYSDYVLSGTFKAVADLHYLSPETVRGTLIEFGYPVKKQNRRRLQDKLTPSQADVLKGLYEGRYEVVTGRGATLGVLSSTGLIERAADDLWQLTEAGHAALIAVLEDDTAPE